jgi:protein-S-isoprenylcysteine O-methyltransferase Ste14
MSDSSVHVLERVAACTIAFVALILLVWALADLTPISSQTAVGIGTYTGFGVMVLAWRWPRVFTGPIRRLMK